MFIFRFTNNKLYFLTLSSISLYLLIYKSTYKNFLKSLVYDFFINYLK